MPKFVPHKLFIELLWYGGMEMEDIDATCTDLKYNTLEPSVYMTILNGAEKRKGWTDAHKENRKRYLHNMVDRYQPDLKPLYTDVKHLDSIPYKNICFDIISYYTGARKGALAYGTNKVLRIFNTDALRQYVETALLINMSAEAITQYLSVLDSASGVWTKRVVLMYSRIFWNASQRGIRQCDIRYYFNVNAKNDFYDVHQTFMNQDEPSLLAFYGIADYSMLIRKNKRLHGIINSRMNDFFLNKSKKVLPSDYIKLYMHLDSQITTAEVGDKGTEAYRNEIKRIFERIGHIKENYKHMDELNDMIIVTEEGIEKDEPYIKVEKD